MNDPNNLDWPIHFRYAESQKIKRRAEMHRRTPRQEVLVLLRCVEALEADIDDDLRAQIKMVKGAAAECFGASCMQCVVQPRTGSDLLCDSCRRKKQSSIAHEKGATRETTRMLRNLPAPETVTGYVIMENGRILVRLPTMVHESGFSIHDEEAESSDPNDPGLAYPGGLGLGRWTAIADDDPRIKDADREQYQGLLDWARAIHASKGLPRKEKR